MKIENFVKFMQVFLLGSSLTMGTIARAEGQQGQHGQNGEQGQHDGGHEVAGRCVRAVAEAHGDRHVADHGGDRGGGGHRHEQHTDQADGVRFEALDGVGRDGRIDDLAHGGFRSGWTARKRCHIWSGLA